MSKEAIKKYLADIGRKGGSVSSDAKTEANRRNAKLPRKKENRAQAKKGRK